MDNWQKDVYDKAKLFAESRVIVAHHQKQESPCEPVIMEITQEEAYIIMKAMEMAYLPSVYEYKETTA